MMTVVMVCCLVILLVTVSLGSHQDDMGSQSELLDNVEHVRTKRGRVVSALTIHGCEGREIVLTCPHYSRMFIEAAFYGRNWLWNLCATYNSYEKCSTNGMDAVKTQCEGQRRCQFMVENKIFDSDPCPGKIKHLSVTFRCRSVRGNKNKAYACEDSRLVLVCPYGRKVKVLSAIWGRQSTEICDPKKLNDWHARARPGCSKDVKPVLAGRCDGKDACEIWAKNTEFGDPCRGNSKYLEVKFHCI